MLGIIKGFGEEKINAAIDASLAPATRKVALKADIKELFR